ncbi:conserved exported protein of unknown function [Nitrospira sp. KM1]|uniref:hypothetical protein n=1 Tax=Nitrospira sp. KM1 TaxID=1936990 RepID=UPI0013A75A7D|nr:hypothetical protein [Nitrospira sp. KM1]BCA56083.1 conserved exported protein of unknown function [Nitrospira sp. KM1]
MISPALWFRLLICLFLTTYAPIVMPSDAAASGIEQLTDLTGRTSAIVTLKGRDNFTSEYRYDISVRNHSPDTLIADSLIVVLEKITNLAGEEREPLKSEPILSRFDILGQDGETDDGKPYFRIPSGSSPDLVPQAESRPAVVRIRNKDYLAVFTPSFRVYGMKRPPPETKQPGSPSHSLGAQRVPADRQTEKLIQLLLKKGVITEEEWRKAMQP